MTTVAPIRIVKGKIFVEALLNHSERASLLLDTGADRPLLTPELADHLGIDFGANGKRHRIQLVGRKIIEIVFAALSETKTGEAVVDNLLVGICSVFPEQPSMGGLLGCGFLTFLRLPLIKATAN